MPKKYPAPYSLHPSYDYVASGLVNLQERTGKTMEEWTRIVKSDGPKTEKEQAEWLKATHGLTTNYARWVAEWAAGKGSPDDYDPQKLVDELFAGPKAGLKPLYDRLIEVGQSIAKDVKFCPCKTFVPFFRNHVIAQVKPATKTRIDFGLALGKTADLPDKLIDTGGALKGDRITHKIEVTSAIDICDFLKTWLKFAYDLDAK